MAKTKIFGLFVAAFCLIVLFAIILIGVDVYRTNLNIEIEAMRNQGRKIASNFDHHLHVQEVTLAIASAEAKSVLNHDELPLSGTVLDLVPAENQHGYTFQLPEGKTESQFGSLTGLGEITAVDTKLAYEINMALSLSPIFEQVILNDPSIIWIYYTSISRFIYMYPSISPEDFFYSDVLLDTAFFTVATPEQDPERKMVWTPLYEDQAGKGWMVTLSQPIYQDDRFLGVLSIDIGIANLKWLLESVILEHATPYLIDPNGNVMAGLDDKVLDIDVVNLPSEQMIKVGERTLMVFPLDEYNWYIVFDVNQNALRREAAISSSPYGFALLLMVFGLIIILIITRNMNSARYLAIHDNLTGVLNRRGFDDFAHELIRKNILGDDYLGLAIVDIDLFKKYNDRYGHQAGDNTLRRVANALKNDLRSPNDRVFRVGGEEFAVLIFLKSPEEMPKILDRLVVSVYELGIPHTDSPFTKVTVSAGGITTNRVTTLHQLEAEYKRADDALYTAKAAGRNRWALD